MRKQRTAAEVVALIERLLDGSARPHDWDDFESPSISDPVLETVRKRCAEIPRRFPSSDRTHFASPKGLEALREIARDLRSSIPEVEAIRCRAHEIALMAKSLYVGAMSGKRFIDAIESQDYDNPYVDELIDRIAHQPTRGGILGASALEHDRYVAEVQEIIARVLSETGDVAV